MVFKKKFIFITGAPRSGTSLITKVIDAHEDIAILMENNLGNRRRHWKRSEIWDSDDALRNKLESLYLKLKEPVLGNKIITPEVWNEYDIIRICRLFDRNKIIFVVRDPRFVASSRLKREPDDFYKVYNKAARSKMPIDFSSRLSTYFSSWRQSIENYWRLKDTFGKDVKIVYYEDFCRDFNNQIKDIFSFLEIRFSERVLRWNEYPHRDKNGDFCTDLKYKDEKIFDRSDIQKENIGDFEQYLQKNKMIFKLWENREL